MISLLVKIICAFCSTFSAATNFKTYFLIFFSSSVTPTSDALAPSPSLPQPTTRTWWLSGRVTTWSRRSTTQGRGHTCQVGPRTGPLQPWHVLLPCIKTPGRSCTLLEQNCNKKCKRKRIQKRKLRQIRKKPANQIEIKIPPSGAIQ